MKNVFQQFRETKTQVFKGVTFTLLQPSAYSRSQYLLAVEECAKQDKALKAKSETGEVDTSNISFKLVAENQRMSLYLIALCLYESLEHKPTLEQCRQDLEQTVTDGFVEVFYPLCEALTWPEPPKDALDPKLDQGIDSLTD